MRIVEARLEDWPLPDGMRFDLVFAATAWHWVDPHERYQRTWEALRAGHIAMQPWQRERLYTEIRRRLAERPDGRLRRHWGGVLHIARRRD